MLGIEEETCKVELSSGPTDFRSTVVKLYFTEETNDSVEEYEDGEIPSEITNIPPVAHTDPVIETSVQQKQGRSSAITNTPPIIYTDPVIKTPV